MTTREEKILEILSNQRMKHFGAISPMNYPELVLELASLFERMYPKEFVEWYKDQDKFIKCFVDDKECWLDVGYSSFRTTMQEDYHSFNDVYEYYKSIK
jgi:hypothetical protein